MPTDQYSLEPTDLELINGYRIKPIGNRFAVLNSKGMSVHSLASPRMAVSRLIELRAAWADGYAARCYESNQVTRNILGVA